MRELSTHELSHVSGAGSSCYDPCRDPCKNNSKNKGNNGYGNGGHDGVPGNSGKTGGGKAQDRVR
ncbi:MAG TPA: hypothetical protein VGC46_15620 [Allosphingosinicella sp.]